MKVRAVVWGENVHEQQNPTVRAIYPDGIHGCIVSGLNQDALIDASSATLQEPKHGLTEARPAATDVLLWWGHCAHSEVADAVVERVQRRVWRDGADLPAARWRRITCALSMR